MTQEEKAKRYNEALERARAFNNGEDVNIEAGTTLCEYIFPELKESEDEKVKKAIFGMVYDSYNELWRSYDVSKSDILAWLEKQIPIDKEKVLISARKNIALSIMNFLDKNTLGMCLSNMECEDLEDAVVNSDWSKVYNYMKKKLEKQDVFSQKDVDDAYLKGVTDTKKEIEKQYEANSQIRKDIATFIFNYRGDIKDRAKWMDYLGIKVSFVKKSIV